jgi:transcriptional regulator with XRE-family HTH domain
MDTKTLIQHLGQRVRTLRIARGWSQEYLAERCGRHFTYIGRIERGEQNVTVQVLNEVASALSVSIADILAVDQPRLLADWRVAANDVVEAVSRGFRAQVDVKGKLAELMLHRELDSLKKQGEIQAIEWLDEDGRPDFIVKWKGRQVIVECKNVRSPDSKRKS